ncbi:MAG: hypothetical protein GC191_19405 [Azospirillum sp.]|nr:hypothetical protein [Azospirillum sp.]
MSVTGGGDCSRPGISWAGWHRVLGHRIAWVAGSLAVAAGVSLAPAAALAQQLPGATEPGRLFERVQPPPAPPEPLPDIQLPKLAPRQLPANASTTTVVVNAVDIQGASVYESEELRELYQDLLGKPVSLAALFGVADRLEATYRGDGYILTRVIVPEQRISHQDPRFQINVIEGFISKVEVTGDFGGAEDAVRGYVEALQSDEATRRPARLSEIERALLLANDVSGVSAFGTFRPAANEFGGSVLVVSGDRRSVDGYSLIDNRGSRLVGPWSNTTNIGENSMLGIGERLDLTGLMTLQQPREQKLIQATWTQPLGSSGLRFKGLAGYGKAHPGYTLRPLNVNSDAVNLSGELDYPIVRSRYLNMYFDTGFYYLNTQTQVLGNLFTKDHIRYGFADARLDWRDSLDGTSIVKVELRQGLPILNSSRTGDELLSRAEGTGLFTTIRPEFSRLQDLGWGFSFLTRVTGQYSFNKLLASQEYSLGELTTGRGYDPATATGENGWGGTGELEYTINTGFEWVPLVQVYTFFDYGRVYNFDTGARNERLYSAGTGLRLSAFESFDFDFWAAQPLKRTSAFRPEQDMPPRFHAVLVGRF